MNKNVHQTSITQSRMINIAQKALVYSRTTNVELKIYASAAIIITYLVLVLNHRLNLQYLQYLQKFLQVRL